MWNCLFFLLLALDPKPVTIVALGDLWIGYHDVPKGWMFPRATRPRLRARRARCMGNCRTES
ncbi:MAG: hypothetical protein FJ388_00405 [Verrucomicrobia bacterium]|nr:hypothetical protein [Verrucomicrobiota bacterium]